MKKLLVSVLTVFALLAISCDNENESNPIFKEKIGGVVQKGPFINGSTVQISELTANYAQTGKTFSTQVTDQLGNFTITNIGLTSPYILLQASGFYFNEVTGRVSNAPITLQAISDITNKDLVNANLLSHLEKGRVEYLLSKGNSFINAKRQAKQEVLSIFGFAPSEMTDFELLNITHSGENHAMLLAVSVILQGFRTEAELSKLLADIASDICEDGILNNGQLKTSLITDVKLVNLGKVREHIEEYYRELDITIPNFEDYVTQFINNSGFESNTIITYPEFGDYGENILYGDKAEFGTEVSLAADLANGASLRIMITGAERCTWSYPLVANTNWTISSTDGNTQFFTSIESGKKCDLRMIFEPGEYRIIFYENNFKEDTRGKYITIK